MAGGQFFIVYTSADGKNVTVSSRLGTGHEEPKSGNAANVTRLSGSGVKNGSMIANIRCSNCETWNGGSMDFSSSSAGWMMASREGSPLDTDDIDADISQHTVNHDFSWDFTTAKGGSMANPFLAYNATADQASSSTSSSGGSEGGDGDDGGDGGISTATAVHAALASLTFVILLPSGSILLRLSSWKPVVVHWVIQATGYVLFLVAFGLGIWISQDQDLEDAGHAILGYIIFVVILFQPLLGLLHHRRFKTTGRRGFWSVAHLVIGRTVIVLGIINGGLGLALADDASTGARIAYGVLGGLFGIGFLAVAVSVELKRYRGKKVDSISGEDEIIQLREPRPFSSSTK